MKKIIGILPTYRFENTDSPYDDVYKFVHRNYDRINSFADDISDNLDLSGFENLKKIATLIRKGTVYIIEIAIAICVVLLIIFRASIHKVLMWIHVVTLPVAVIFITIGTLGTNLVNSIVEKLRILFLAAPFVTYFTRSMVRYGVVLIIISVISLGLHILMKVSKKKKKKREEQEKKLDTVLE